jgi:hypothetical protein
MRAVLITGFAKFARVDRAVRMGPTRRPESRSRLPRRKARITPLKTFKEAVLRKSTKKVDSPGARAAQAGGDESMWK